MSHDEKTKKAIGELVKASWYLGLASGSGQEVFEDGRIFTFEELMQRYQEADAEVVRLLGFEEGPASVIP